MSSRRIISAQANSEHPDPNVEPYTFDRLADAMQGFLDVLGLKHYTLYMTDFGGPVGLRLMERDPEAVEAVIVQNANCYLEGVTPARQAYFRRAHDDRSPEGVAFVYERTGAHSIINQQYLRDVLPERRDIMNPDAWTSDLGFPPGAEAYLRDLPHAELHLIDAGHFAVEEKPAEIAAYVLNFMKSRER
jgi:pimeloyl-ACP methyl ester carboxylesterase